MGKRSKKSNTGIWILGLITLICITALVYLYCRIASDTLTQDNSYDVSTIGPEEPDQLPGDVPTNQIPRKAPKGSF